MNDHYKRSLLSIVIITIVTLTSGCDLNFLFGRNATSDENKANVSLNNEIRLRRSIDGYTNEYVPYSISDGLLYLEIDNLSEATIEFSSDFDVELYIYDETDMDWKVLHNNIDYGSVPNTLLPKSAEFYIPQLVILVPDIQPDLQPDDTILLKIIVEGRVIDGSMSGEGQVGASLEIELQVDETNIGNTNDI